MISRLIKWIIGAILVFVVGSILWVLLYRIVPPPITITQIADRLSGRHLSRDWMSLDHMDRDMVRAAIAAEDSKFCSHHGFDRDAIVAAMLRNAAGGHVIRGGSTISQQTAKNAFLWQGGGYARKGAEAWFTFLIEHLWGKRRIMEVYLNVAETGLGTYGANAGSQRYFGHDASNLSRTEAARIAAILPLPKKRGAITPHGFTRRYGNSIAARINIVARDGLDGCVYRNAAAAEPVDRPAPKPKMPKKAAKPAQVQPQPPVEIPGQEYEQPVDAPAPPPDNSSSSDDTGDV